MRRYGLVVSEGPSIRGGTTSSRYPLRTHWSTRKQFHSFFLSRLSVEQTVKWSLKQTSQYTLQKPEEWVQHMLTTGCDFPVCWQTSDLVTSTVNGGAKSSGICWTEQDAHTERWEPQTLAMAYVVVNADPVPVLTPGPAGESVSYIKDKTLQIRSNLKSFFWLNQDLLSFVS